MSEDVVRQLGYLALGTRLKRIGDRLQADTQQILDAHGVTIPSGQFPFLAAIDRLGPLTVGGLARAVGITQPGATRTVSQLVAAGLVSITSGGDDQRRKTVRLTFRGKHLVSLGKRAVWPEIERAVRDLCQELSGSLLEQLAALEDGLTEAPLLRRTESSRERRR